MLNPGAESEPVVRTQFNLTGDLPLSAAICPVNIIQPSPQFHGFGWLRLDKCASNALLDTGISSRRDKPGIAMFIISPNRAVYSAAGNLAQIQVDLCPPGLRRPVGVAVCCNRVEDEPAIRRCDDAKPVPLGLGPVKFEIGFFAEPHHEVGSDKGLVCITGCFAKTRCADPNMITKPGFHPSAKRITINVPQRRGMLILHH